MDTFFKPIKIKHYNDLPKTESTVLSIWCFHEAQSIFINFTYKKSVKILLGENLHLTLLPLILNHVENLLLQITV